MIKKAIFETSVGKVDQLINSEIPEIAVIGKSNVGKSSCINALTNNKHLAKTSKDPGRTRLINYFKCNDKYYLVDLPGYGYAKVAESEKAKWAALIEEYFKQATCIAHIFMLVDIRHDPTADDLIMLHYLYHFSLPFTIIATKSDKLSKVQRNRQRDRLATVMKVGRDDIIVVSAEKKEGLDAVYNKIDSALDLFYNPPELEPEDFASDEV